MSKCLYLRTFIATLFILSTATTLLGEQKPSESFFLDNGMQVLLKENHGSPMVASVVFVRSGSKYESRFENGITHFLEHFLFDGTKNQTREEIGGGIRNLGGYLNAFTRKELTAYMVLLPKQFIDYGLTVQADMLFCSLIPEEELAKERKVVIEEINRSADAAGAVAEEFFTSKAYEGTDYARPVLGYKAFIENIPREAIVSYWKKDYTPDKMVTLIIGDFETDKMKEIVKAVFGQFKPSPEFKSSDALPESNILSHFEASSMEAIDKDAIKPIHIFRTKADVKSSYIDISIPAPHFSDSDYFGFTLLAEYLALDEISPLKLALKKGDKPLATEVGVSLETLSEFSRLNISVISSDSGAGEEVIDTIRAVLGRMSDWSAEPKAIKGIKTTAKCDDIYMSEKLHYYGFMIAPMIMTTGWDFVQEMPARYEATTWADAQEAAKNWLESPRLDDTYIATIVNPITDSSEESYSMISMTAEEVQKHFDTATFESYDLSKAPELSFPSTDSISFEMVDNAEYYREVLDNGLVVLIKSSDASEVFAISLLGKNRTASEPEGKAGITDFVNRCLDKGTATRTAAEFSSDLASIGANLTLYDNPWIPYDDRYTTRQFSFIKFETIDEYASKGFELFTDMITHPRFDSAEVERVRASMLGIIGRASTSPSKVSGNLFYSTLFEGSAYARPLSGTSESIGSLTIQDIRNHHLRFYAPQNMILAIATSKPVEEVLNWVKESLGKADRSDLVATAASPPSPVSGIRSAHSELDKEQVSIILGGKLPGANDPDAVSLRIATSVLSHRLYLTLRERQGLAYSTGAGARFDPDFGWYYCTIGTASENLQKALDGLLFQINKLRLDGPTASEVSRARNSLWGRLMSSKLSRLNQAYYMALDEYLEHGLNYDNRFLEELQDVSPSSVQRVVSKYFRTDAYVQATAGKLP